MPRQAKDVWQKPRAFSGIANKTTGSSDYLTDTSTLRKYMDNNPDVRLWEKHDPGRAA
jgi:hypothetical protein